MAQRLIVAIAIASISLTACVMNDAPEPHETFRTSSQEIRGGVEAPELNATVGMFAAGGICSGTLIAPNLVLTAQHCIASTATEYVICGQTSFGPARRASDIYITTKPWLTNNASNYHGVSEVVIPPGSNDMCGFDIALLVLSSNVPETEATPRVPRVDSVLQTGETYTAVGFGHVGDGSGTGIRRKIEGRAVQCAGLGCPAYTSVAPTEFLGTEGTCQGDSGGTAFDEKGRVIGALSRGPSGCAASVYSGVHGWADWMRDVGAEAAVRGGYEPHIWVTHGLSEIPPNDLDLDGITIDFDNCPDVENPEQIDTDEDGAGDACDFNQDTDSIDDEDDNCPLTDNEDQLDFDLDGFGDACDDDDDEDGILDDADFCPTDSNYFEYDSPCGAEPNLNIVIEEEKGCATAGSAAAPNALLLLGFLLLGRRRRR